MRTQNMMIAAAVGLAGIATAIAASNAAGSDEAMRSFIERNPEAIVTALNSLQERQQAASDARLAATVTPVARRIVAGDRQVASIGPAGGRPVVEFFDYNCGYCKQFARQTVPALLRQGVRLHLVQTPILGPGSFRMAEFAAAAQLQGRFQPAHDHLMEQTARTLDDAERLRPALVSAARLDRAAFDRALSSGAAKAIVDHNAALSRSAGVTGTPLVYANGRIAPGAVPADVVLGFLSTR